MLTESGGDSCGGDVSSRGCSGRGVTSSVGHGIVDEERATGAVGAGRRKGVSNDNIGSARHTPGGKAPGLGSAVSLAGHKGYDSGGDDGVEEEEGGKPLAASVSRGSGGLESPAIETALGGSLRRSASETTADRLIDSGRATPLACEHKPSLLAPPVSGAVALDPLANISTASEEETLRETLDSLGAVPVGARRAARSAEAAFERLAEARERAAGSSWGGVSFAGSGSDKEEIGDAWAASVLGAKLVCNGMVSLSSQSFLFLSTVHFVPTSGQVHRESICKGLWTVD